MSITTEQWEQRARDNAEQMIEIESMMDTYIECCNIGDAPSGAYGMLRTGLNMLQQDLEAAGIKGQWTTWAPEQKAEPPTPEEAKCNDIRHGLTALKVARDLFKRAGATKTTERIRLALTSAQGAERNAKSQASRVARLEEELEVLQEQATDVAAERRAEVEEELAALKK